MTPEEAEIFHAVVRYLSCRESNDWANSLEIMAGLAKANHISRHTNTSLVDLFRSTNIKEGRMGYILRRDPEQKYVEVKSSGRRDGKYSYRAVIMCSHPECVIRRVHKG